MRHSRGISLPIGEKRKEKDTKGEGGYADCYGVGVGGEEVFVDVVEEEQDLVGWPPGRLEGDVGCGYAGGV